MPAARAIVAKNTKTSATSAKIRTQRHRSQADRAIKAIPAATADNAITLRSMPHSIPTPAGGSGGGRAALNVFFWRQDLSRLYEVDLAYHRTVRQ
jgi:hypothetical protein